MSSWTNDYTEENASAETALRRTMGAKGLAGGSPTDAQARARILSATVASDTEYSYGTAADACARVMLETLEALPELRAQIAGAANDWDRVDLLYDAANKRSDGALRPLGLTGFQVGWAANMAFKLCQPPLAPVKNPAIIELKGE